MNNFHKAICVSAVLVCLLPAAAAAQQVKKHTSEKNGYSIDYPAEWYFHEGPDELEIASAEDAFDADEPGAGLTIMAKEAVAADEGLPEKALQRILGESGSDFILGQAGTRRIGGREWYAVPFSSEENGIEGRIFVLLRGVRVYFIGLFYKQDGAQEKYQTHIEKIVDSFRFAERKLKTFTDPAKGVSFRYPDVARIKNEKDSITVIIEGAEPLSDSAGAAISVTLIDASDEEAEDLDEKGFIAMLIKKAEGEESFTVVSESEPVQVMKTTWYKSVLIIEGKRVMIVIHRNGNHFFAVVSMVDPPAAAGEYEKAFDVFLGSLTFDPKKWAASLNAKE